MTAAQPDDLCWLIDRLREAHLPDQGIHISESERYLIARNQAGLALGGVGLELHPPYALLRSLVVCAGARGAGLGRTLVSAAEDLARGHGVRSLYLLTPDADAFFRRLGYVEIPRHIAPDEMQKTGEFAELCPASAICLSKRLAAASGPDAGGDAGLGIGSDDPEGAA
ncbi:MAG: GNAT family N-acetyltransferase [Gammaproteobacteria bacterium]